MAEGGDVSFGSKADICSASTHVRFTPKSGHSRRKSKCPLWANSGHQRALFNDLISRGKQRGRHRKAERFGGLEVDHKFEISGLDDWQVSRLFAL